MTTILELTKQLVRIPTLTTDQEQCKTALTLIAGLFENVPKITIECFNREWFHSLVVKNFDGTRADICFNGHIDVVPPQTDSQREPIERDWLLFGRGTWDMKDGIALISLLMKDLCTTENMTKNLMLMITADEETGGKNGVGYLTKEWYWADMVMIPDAGNRQEIVIGEKWVINLTLRATGKAWHSSRPWKYDNAIEKLFLAYTKIKERIETPELHEEPNHRWCSVQLTTITGGQATNMIPAEAEGKVNIRYTEATSYEWVVHNIEEIAEVIWWVQVVIDMHGVLLFTDPSHRIIKHYQSIAQEQLGETTLVKEHGASDGRFFAEHGSVVILQKPTCDGIHGPEESTTIAEMEEIYNVYKEFALTV